MHGQGETEDVATSLGRAIQEIPVKAGKLVAPLLQKGLLLLLILTTEKQRALEREKMEKGHSPS